jgi:hypothetical protein
MNEWQTVEIKSHPLTGARWVKCVAKIRKNVTGEVRCYETHEILHDGEPHPSVFNWQENNYGCDCNRELFFERACGKEIESPECSQGRYSVNLLNPVTGVIYYREFADASAGDA